MGEYSIKVADKDFRVLKNNSNAKGSREKLLVVDLNGEEAFFKYEGRGYLVSEACSEKMCYEIAKVLCYDCARIELAKDSCGNIGILNYLFIENDKIGHLDAVSFLNIHDDERKNYYTISNIKRVLDKFGETLFKDFVKIMVFDALVGEQDRHEENWGIRKINDEYVISPLYDNGCSLLRNFRDKKYAEEYYNGKKSFDAYTNKSKTIIYKEDNKTQYKHFELIEYLCDNYRDIVYKEILNLNKLTDSIIDDIVKNIPNDLLTKMHKEYIIKYLKKRRNILLNMLNRE